MDFEEFKKVVLERKSCDGSRYKMSYSATEREFAVGFALEKQVEGYSMLRISQELGVSQSTLIKWIKPRKKTGGKFKQVSLKTGFSLRGLSVVNPSGYRIEGLCLDDCVQILSQLK